MERNTPPATPSSRRSDDRLISTTEPAAAPAAPATANTQASAGPTRCVRKRQPCQRFENRLGSVQIATACGTSQRIARTGRTTSGEAAPVAPFGTQSGDQGKRGSV